LSYNITYKKSVYKDLKRIPKNEAAKILNKLDNDLSREPNKFPLLKGKFKGLRKFRVGD
jgi:mRNA interferase RelE/StbE